MIKVRRILALTSVLMLLTAGLAFGADGPVKLGTVLRLSVGADDGIPARRGVGNGRRHP